MKTSKNNLAFNLLDEQIDSELTGLKTCNDILSILFQSISIYSKNRFQLTLCTNPKKS